MDYVHVKSAAGDVKTTVGAYLTGVLKNGFNIGGEIDKPKQDKEEQSQNKKVQTSAFYKHRLERMLELYSLLSESEVEQLKEDFIHQASPSDKIAMSADGLNNNDTQLINSFNNYLFKVLLTAPEDTDINVYAKTLN